MKKINEKTANIAENTESQCVISNLKGVMDVISASVKDMKVSNILEALVSNMGNSDVYALVNLVAGAKSVAAFIADSEGKARRELKAAYLKGVQSHCRYKAKEGGKTVICQPKQIAKGVYAFTPVDNVASLIRVFIKDTEESIRKNIKPVTISQNEYYEKNSDGSYKVVEIPDIDKAMKEYAIERSELKQNKETAKAKELLSSQGYAVYAPECAPINYELMTRAEQILFVRKEAKRLGFKLEKIGKEKAENEMAEVTA